MDDVASNLRTITPSETALFNQQDTFFRKNLLDLPDPRPKKNKKKIPTVKYHSTDWYKNSNDEAFGTTLGDFNKKFRRH
jgi:hypothetical protein